MSLCCWIGGGWCQVPDDEGDCLASQNLQSKVRIAAHNKGSVGKGVHAKGDGPKPRGYDRGKGTIPNLYNEGRKVHADPSDSHRPQLADAFARGRGVHGNDAADHYLSQQRPELSPGGNGGDDGKGVHSQHDLGTCASRRAWLVDWFSRLRDRLRTVRVCSGDFMRVMDSESVTTRLGLTGIFADPPYLARQDDGTDSRDGSLYATDGDGSALVDIRDRLLSYCLERGSNPKMRICVAYYSGDGYEVLKQHGWDEVSWAAAGGYGNRSKKGKANAKRERLIFSPHCVPVAQKNLFDGLE
jgi:hypothetical protein